MAPTTKKRKQLTKDVAVVSTEDKPLTKKPCTCTCIDCIKTVKVQGNMDTSASCSKSKEPVTRRAPAVKSKAAVVTPRTPRSNKGKLQLMSEPRTPITRSKQQQLLSVQEPSTLEVQHSRQDPPTVPFARKCTPRSNKGKLQLMSEPRTPITRSKKQQLLSVQEPSTLEVQHSRQDPPTVPFARKWSHNDELCILRSLQEHRQLHGKQPDLAVLYEKITRDGSFDNQDAGIPEFKDKVRKLLRLYKKMVSMKDPKGDNHKIELFRIACNVWGDLASNAHAHGANVDANIDATADAALNNDQAHGLAAPLGAHVGEFASPDAPGPAAPLHAGTGAPPDALAAPATVGKPLPVNRAVSSPAALALAMSSLPSGTTTTSSCANRREEDMPPQWLRVVLWWGSRIAFLIAFAAFMSPGWRKGGCKGGDKEFMELGGLLP